MAVYGLALRERVLAAYERHGNKSFVCREYQIARTTLDDWLRWQAEGRLKPVAWSRGRRSYVEDWEVFRSFVEHASFRTLKELQGLYNAHFPRAISLTSLHDGLKRIGYTHKKRPSRTLKQIVRNKPYSNG